jgi:hypothetical protein
VLDVLEVGADFVEIEKLSFDRKLEGVEDLGVIDAEDIAGVRDVGAGHGFEKPLHGGEVLASWIIWRTGLCLGPIGNGDAGFAAEHEERIFGDGIPWLNAAVEEDGHLREFLDLELGAVFSGVEAAGDPDGHGDDDEPRKDAAPAGIVGLLRRVSAHGIFRFIVVHARLFFANPIKW